MLLSLIISVLMKMETQNIRTLEDVFEITIKAGISKEHSFEEYQETINKLRKFLETDAYENKISKIMLLAKALSSEVRLKILSILLIREKTCLCELNELLGIDPSTLTYHVNLLKQAKLIKVKRKGKTKLVLPEKGMADNLPKDFVESLELKKKKE